MHELLHAAQPEGVHLLLDDVLHGLHVVVGHRLDLLHTRGVGRREVAVEAPQGLALRRAHARELRQRDFAQGDEIFHFDPDAVADQGLFRKIIGEFLRFTTVTAVYGRDGGEFGQHIVRTMIFVSTDQIYDI